MSEIIAANGKPVTEEMVASWSEALDRDEWPEGWRNVGTVVEGLPSSQEAMSTISFKVPASMRRAIERKAKEEGVSISAFARSALVDRLIAAGT